MAGSVGNYPHIILRPRDEGSRDINQGPERYRVSQVAVLLTGEGYKRWFPVSRVRFFL